jgi:hypothetical protein
LKKDKLSQKEPDYGRESGFTIFNALFDAMVDKEKGESKMGQLARIVKGFRLHPSNRAIPNGCQHNLGHLAGRRSSAIPEKCLICKKLVECLRTY